MTANSLIEHITTSPVLLPSQKLVEIAKMIDSTVLNSAIQNLTITSESCDMLDKDEDFYAKADIFSLS